MGIRVFFANLVAVADGVDEGDAVGLSGEGEVDAVNEAVLLVDEAGLGEHGLEAGACKGKNKLENTV